MKHRRKSLNPVWADEADDFDFGAPDAIATDGPSRDGEARRMCRR
jgi:hypothetical protein